MSVQKTEIGQTGSGWRLPNSIFLAILTAAKRGNRLMDKDNKKDLPYALAEKLAERIHSGEFKPGDKLTSERELSLEYAVSRTTVREALSQLKSMGLVEARAGSGVYVTENPDTKLFRMPAVDLGEDESFAQVMELLLAIEVAATRSAAIHRTPADLRAIRRELIGMEYAVARDMLGDQEDYNFHQAIVKATHNPYFVSLCSHLEYSARNVIRTARANTRRNLSDLMDAVQKEHQEIYEAIEAGDPERAANAAADHLNNALKRVQFYRKA